jgi:membrane peptidoglycan carboxypeptidase
MTEIMKWVVEHGTGTAVALPTYNIAGKTGTAYKFVNGRYASNNYVASFVGFVPAEDPKYVIYVSLDDPRGLYWGGYTAGPVFKEVAKRVLAYDLVPATNDVQTATAPKDQRTVPSFAGLTRDQCEWLAEACGLTLKFTGRGPRVVAQSAAPGAPLMAGEQNPGKVVLTLGKPEIAAMGGLMPELRGKTKRQALALLAPLGLKVNFQGEGVVRSQYPTAGRSVGPDAACQLNCDVPVSKASAVPVGGHS